MKNWWYYYKWYVIIGILVLGNILSIVCNALHLFYKSPDIQIAYIGKAPLGDAAVDSITQIFTSIADDYNKDGTVLIKLNQYTNEGSSMADSDSFYYQYASEVTLISDINDCESYFFLMDDPASFQIGYQVLALPDGSEPDEFDYSVDGKCYSLQSLPTFQNLSLPDTTEPLFLGRRYFYQNHICKNKNECDRLWNTLMRQEVSE